MVVLVVAALRYRHGSQRAELVWLGTLSYLRCALWLVFSVLMGSSIIATMVLMTVAGAANTCPRR